MGKEIRDARPAFLKASGKKFRTQAEVRKQSNNSDNKLQLISRTKVTDSKDSINLL